MPAAASTTPVEPITVEDEERHTVFPLKDVAAWRLYKELEASQWVAQELDFSKDQRDWQQALTAGDRAYYRFTFGMFGAADEKVIANLGESLLREIRLKEAVYFFGVQAYNEQVHSESYSQQIQAIFPDPAEQRDVMDAVVTMPVIGKMMAWANKWMDRPGASGARNPLGVRLMGWAFFEGGLFQGQFLGLQLLKIRGLMPGVTMLNEFIARDEGKHCAFACFLVRERILNRPSQETVHQIAREMVDLYDEFTLAAIAAACKAEGLDATAPCPVKHISAGQMREYIRHVADAVCVMAGYERPFMASNPYPEASMQSLNEVGKTNFFEFEPTQYNLRVDTRVRPRAARCKKIDFCQPAAAVAAVASA